MLVCESDALWFLVVQIYFRTKTYVVTPHLNRLGFYGEVWKITPICSYFRNVSCYNMCLWAVKFLSNNIIDMHFQIANITDDLKVNLTNIARNQVKTYLDYISS